MDTHTTAPAAEGGPSESLFIERTGKRQYVARNHRDAAVNIGDGPGEFTPGELLKIAVAACNAMSSDSRLSSVLGDDFQQFTGVSAVSNKEENRYESFQVELVQDLSALSDEERADLIERATRAIHKNCTVGHTVEQSATYSATFTSEKM